MNIASNTSQLLFAAVDRAGYSVWFQAAGWDEAESVALEHEFTGLGLLDSVYPAADEVTRWAGSRDNMQ